MVDPIASLRQFRPRQIIFVVSGESPMPDLPPSAPPAGLPDRRLAWKATARSEQPETRSVDGQDVVVVRDPIFDILPSGAVAGWQLIPYVDRVSPEVVVNFRRVAEALLNWERDSFGAKVSDPSVRRDLVTRHRSKMARAYRHAFKDKNTTSLSLYSGPAHPSTTGAVQLWPFAPATDTAKVAWMGTGDADLKDHDAIARFERHYRDGMPYVSTFLLPHHGSIHNSNPYKLVSDADRWVASAEPIHPWEHPAQALIDAVSARGRGFQHVKSNQSSAFDEALIVFWPN